MADDDFKHAQQVMKMYQAAQDKLTAVKRPEDQQAQMRKLLGQELGKLAKFKFAKHNLKELPTGADGALAENHAKLMLRQEELVQAMHHAKLNPTQFATEFNVEVRKFREGLTKVLGKAGVGALLELDPEERVDIVDHKLAEKHLSSIRG